jgi:hypothetical protein
MNAPIPSLHEVESRMAAGAFSQEGFLGARETLAEVIERDMRLLAEHGLDRKVLARRLDELITLAKSSRIRRARRGLVLAKVTVYRGFQLCPWTPHPPEQCSAGEGVTHASAHWRLRNLKNGATLSGPGLAVHLIRDHEFFGGLEAPNRVDPLALARVLGVSSAG